MVLALIALAATGGQAEPVSVLAFSKTAGFRHDSIPDAVRAVRKWEGSGFKVHATEDAAAFTPAGLQEFDVVVFLLTTGDVLDSAQESALKAWVEAGGGLVGVHSASDTEYDWAWYGGVLGAYFLSHPAVQTADIRVEAPNHASMAMLPTVWRRTDEWYDFRTNPRAGAKVLATLDESSYSGGRMGEDHPIVWCKPVGNGRFWYTALGHTKESYAEPLFLEHLKAGVRWAAKQ
jgi:type 1 glutamine amidotransferase